MPAIPPLSWDGRIIAVALIGVSYIILAVALVLEYFGINPLVQTLYITIQMAPVK